MNQDVRWKQRFQNYKKALFTIRSAVELARERELSELEKQGTIQGFEFTFELAWNLMKDYLEEQGISDIVGSKGAVRQAFNNGLVDDGAVWMEMIDGRNISSHSYDKTTAEKLFSKITNEYFTAFLTLEEKMGLLEN